jgi:hypothetical protein
MPPYVSVSTLPTGRLRMSRSPWNLGAVSRVDHMVRP